MKTHELARALSLLARLLRKGPNVDVEDLKLMHDPQGTVGPGIALNLTTLVKLSELGKKNWVHFIEENGFAIDIRPRDASRDILGKLLRFLEKNPEARAKIRKQVARTQTKGSPELSKALTWLLEA